MNLHWIQYIPFAFLIGIIFINRLQTSNNSGLSDKEKVVKIIEDKVKPLATNSCSIALGYTSCQDLKVKGVIISSWSF